MIIKTSLYFFIITSLFISCNQKGSDNNTNQKINFGDSIKEYINPNKDISVPYIQRIILAAGLDSLDNGYEDMQLRIWLGHSLAIKHDIIILKYKNNKWHGERLSFSKVGNSLFDTKIKILFYEKIFPKSGWSTFFNMVENSQIFTALKDDTPLNCCNSGGADGILYTFELATKNKFHLHSYSNPTSDGPNNVHSKEVLAFANLLEKEFGFEYIK
ncbi:hypothetical protein [Ferruginibacter sp.]|nr:hypothetical protein [Ferruginibacter sp.]